MAIEMLAKFKKLKIDSKKIGDNIFESNSFDSDFSNHTWN